MTISFSRSLIYEVRLLVVMYLNGTMIGCVRQVGMINAKDRTHAVHIQQLFKRVDGYKFSDRHVITVL
jgi:hypothetical protein